MDTQETLQAMQMAGVSLPKHPARRLEKAEFVQKMFQNAGVGSVSGGGQHKEASVGNAGGLSIATPRIFDPRSSQSIRSDYGDGMLNMDKNKAQRDLLFEYCRLFYKTHPVIGACIDVYSTFPVAGVHIDDEDSSLKQFYSELFLDDLNYEQFMKDLGREYWTTGNAFPFANWDKDLGIFTTEELLDCTDIEIHRIPFAKSNIYELIPSEYMKTLARGSEYDSNVFRSEFPEMVDCINRSKNIPVSNDVLSHLARKDRQSDCFGTPVMLRAWNTLKLEDRMHSAMQAIADRLYAPLIMFKMGTLIGDQPWVPDAGTMDKFRQKLDIALSSDFRAIVTHFAITAEEVIKTGSMSAFKGDADMYDEKLFMCFGLSSSILKGGNQTGATNYASSALQMELCSQYLATYQTNLVNHYNRRAKFVAEANGHYETEKQGDIRKIVYEQRKVYNEETEEFEIKDVPKLHYPKIEMETINFRDDEKIREFKRQLRQDGVPISNEELVVGIDIDLKASAEKLKQEQINTTVLEMEKNTALLEIALAKGLIVPPEVVTYAKTGIAPFKFQKMLEEFSGTPTKPAPSDVPTAPLQSDALIGDVQQQMDGVKDMSTPDVTSEGVNGGGVRPNISDEQRADAPKQQ